MACKKEKRGGKRLGAGRPKGEPTTTINFRIKKATKNQLIEKYGKRINKMFLEWVKTVIK
jgi:hypothetical protein